MRNKRTRTVILLLSLSLLPESAVQSAMAKEGAKAYQPDLEHYLGKVGAPQKGGFLQEEVRKYRAYPRLDRAYRMQSQGRLAEARKDFEAYLALAPEDIRVQLSYLVLLKQMSLHKEVISRCDLVLGRWPGFVPAYLLKGAAYQKLRAAEGAFAAFSQAAAAQDVRKEDRIFALSSAADLAVSRKKYAEGGAILQALAEGEKKQVWYLKAGGVFEQGGELRKSLDAYGAALELAGSPEQKVYAALALAEVAKKLNLPERARDGYLAAVESDAGNRTALRALADLAYQWKRYDEAEKWMLLLKKSGITAKDREFLAQLHLRRGDYAAAIPELQGVVAQKGKGASEQTLTALAQAYESAGKHPESVSLYRRLLATAPERGDLRLRLGNLLVGMENYQSAEPLLRKALSAELSAAQRSTAHRNLSLIYEKGGDHEKAGRHLKLSLQSRPAAGGETLVRLAVLLSKGGKGEDAIPYLDRALADPALPDHLRRLAHREKSAILERGGNLRAAAAELAKALEPGAKGDAETRVRLAVLLGKTGSSKEALGHLDLALADPSLAGARRRVALREKGMLLERGGHPLAAAKEYEEAVAAGERSPEMYLVLANLYHRGGEAELAGSYWNKVLNAPDAGTAERCSAADSLALERFPKGGGQEALPHLAAALRLCGESWQRRYYSGLAHYRARDWQKALEQFQLADAQKRDVATLLGIALCNKELARPGAAIHYLQLALEAPGAATAQRSKEIHETLGYLYAEEHAFSKAADAFARALAHAPDNIVRLNLAVVLHLAGDTERSWQALNEVDATRLPPPLAVAHNDLKAGLLQGMGRVGEARALMEQTLKLEATPARSHALGVLYQASGRRQAAIERFEAAYEEEPRHDEYALSLGYAYLADRRFPEAIAPLTAVADRNPDFPKTMEDLGYLHSRLGENEHAVRWFKKALDAFPAASQGSPEEGARREKDAHRIRSEIGKLTKRFGGLAYATYRGGNAPGTLLTAGESISAGLSGQTGVEGWYRPPKIGFRDERILEIFGRVFGNLDSNSLSYSDDSTQGGVGVRYKLLRSENLWISGERLFRIGRAAQNDWLFRLLYSRGTGFEPLTRQRSQDYYLLYGEIDAYVPSDTVAAYGEVRKGRAFTLSSNYLLTPHLVLDSRRQSSSNLGGEYLEGGAGVSLKYFFNGSRYLNYRDHIDFSVTYKHGTLFERGAADYDSVLVSLGVFF